MDNNLRLQVIFNGIDKLSGPIKSMLSGSKGLSKAVKATTGEIKSLNQEAKKVAALSKMKAELSSNHQQLDAVRRKMRDLRSEMEQTVKPTKEMKKSLRELVSEERRLSQSATGQSARLQKLQSELKAAGVDVSNLGKHQTDLANRLNASNRKLIDQQRHLTRVQKIQSGAAKVQSGASSVGTASTIGVSLPLIYFGKEAYSAKMNAAELQSAFNVTFGNMAKDMNAWAETTAKTMGRGKSEMKGMAMSYQLLFDKALDPAKAAEMSKNFTVLTQDLASFRNLANDVAQQKIFAGLSGEAEPLRAVGVFLSEAKVQAAAAAMGLQKVNGELTEEQKILARSTVIRTELAKAQGDVMRTRESEVNKLKEASALYQDMQEDIGGKLLPKLRPLLEIIIKLLDAFNNLSPGMQEFIVMAAGIAIIFGPLMMGLAGLAAGFRMLAGPIALLWGKLGGIAVIFRTIGQIFLWLFRLVAVYNPFVLIIGAIALAAYLIWSYWDQIKAAFFSGVAGLQSAWTAIKGKMGEGMAYLATLPSRALQLGKDIVLGLVNGIWNFGFKVGDALYSLATSAWSRITKFFETRSPSRKFMRLGGYLAEGMAVGIDKSSILAVKSARQMAASVAGASALSISPVSASIGQQSSFQASGAALTPSNGGGGNITINVYGAQGQDVTALAEQVQKAIERAQKSSLNRRYSDDV